MISARREAVGFEVTAALNFFNSERIELRSQSSNTLKCMNLGSTGKKSDIIQVSAQDLLHYRLFF